MQKADVVIIGAGVVGLSAGYWLVKSGAKVAVLEKGQVAWEASSRATGFLSLRGEQPAEVPLALEAEKIWKDLDDELGYPTEWKSAGRLWVACNEDEYRELRDTYTRFSNIGVPFRLIDSAEARRIVPPLRSDISGAIHTERSGHANPQRTSQAFAWALADRGGVILDGTPAIGIDTAGGRVTGVRTPKGTISTGAVVNCAGPQAGLIAEMVGVKLPLAAFRLEAMVTVPLPPLFDVALVANGLSLRQTRRGNIHFNGGPYEWINVGLRSEPPKPSTPAVRNIARRLVELFPTLSYVGLLRCWTGVVEATPDLVTVLEKLDHPDGMVIAVTSGHGFGLAPAVGQVIRDLVLSGKTSVPIEPLALGRFANLNPDWKHVRRWNAGNYNT